MKIIKFTDSFLHQYPFLYTFCVSFFSIYLEMIFSNSFEYNSKFVAIPPKLSDNTSVNFKPTSVPYFPTTALTSRELRRFFISFRFLMVYNCIKILTCNG